MCVSPRSAEPTSGGTPNRARSGRALLRQAGVWPLGLYALLSLALFGLPVLGDPGSRIIASNEIDSGAYMWFLAWWPHALLHGQDPLVTHAMFYPDGYNLTWAAAIPLPSAALAPITLLFGPVLSWNLLALLAPALAAWTAFLLCRRVTGRLWPSLIGGYTFGFSPYVISHLTGAPNLALVALLPVFVLVAVRRLEGAVTPRRFVTQTALLLVAQYLISAEVLLTATVFGAFALLISATVWSDRRGDLLDLSRLLAFAYMAMAVVISPFLLTFLFGEHYPPPILKGFPADLTAFAVPPPLMALARHTVPFTGSNTEDYLGAPLLALIVAFAWTERRSRVARLLVVALVVALVCSLGAHMKLHGTVTSIPAPWALLAHLPLLRYALPSRLALYVDLSAAVIVAVWLARARPRTRGSFARWALVLLALAFIAPDVGTSSLHTDVADPAFFSSGSYRSYLGPHDHVLTVPVLGANQRWIADAGFPFPLTTGYAGQRPPAGYTRFRTWATLESGVLTPGYAAELRRFVAAKHVSAIVVDPATPGPWRKLFGSLGVSPTAVGGVLLYRLSGSARAGA